MVKLLFALFLVIASPMPAMAQKIDFKALQKKYGNPSDMMKRYNEFIKAGNYSAALAEAQRFEGLAKGLWGTNHWGYAAALDQIGRTYAGWGKYAEAVGYYNRAITIYENTKGEKNHFYLAESQLNLANSYQHMGQYAEAESLIKRSLSSFEKSESAQTHVPKTLNNLANVYVGQGRYGEAEELYKRTLALQEKLKPANPEELANTLNNLANANLRQNRYVEAEPLFRRALALYEQALGANNPGLARALSNLAIVYTKQDRYNEAEGLLKRSIAIFEKTNHPELSNALSGLGNVYWSQEVYDQAEAYYKRALAIREKTLGPAHSSIGGTLQQLAGTSLKQGRYDEALEFLNRGLAIEEKSLGPDHPELTWILNYLGEVHRRQEKYDDAERFLTRAQLIREQKFGPDAFVTAEIIDQLSLVYAQRAEPDKALAASRKATTVVLAHTANEAVAAQGNEGSADFAIQRANFFRHHVAHLSAVATKGAEPAGKLGREAAEIAQWASQSRAGSAIQQMALRFTAGNNALAALVRESQDLAAFRRDRDKALVEALSKLEGQRNAALTESIRRQITETEAKRTAVNMRIEKEFRDYAALASPKPITVEEIQNLLGPNEALVFWLTGDLVKNKRDVREAQENDQTYIFAVTRDDFNWNVVPLGMKELVDKIAAFRRGLDVDAFEKSLAADQPKLFDLALAHELYAALLGPVEALIKDKKHLLAAPSGPLTALPLHLLVTERATEINDVAGYRDAQWLLKRQAVSVLPSVSSLKALRIFARKESAAKPLIGFGDPVFKAGNPQVATAVRTRAYTDYWQGAGVDRSKLADALPRLADTADELKAVAQNLGAPMSDIHLREEASETTVKRAPLADYRVVYFATHGLVAGDIKGLAEPSLALTIPAQPTEFDDGLLTASEVAQLKLNADWVVLSACNTIAGDKPGAEALSGLARAFFYAGARALLVSHWAVESEAATRLTTATFNILNTDPSMGRAEALRRATLAYLADTSTPRNAYPGYWGPFAVIGEGAAR